ncbi:MAG: hypothetical protein NZV14_17695, partial [Bryobacteraceae bacterium]|nr:hypothetical protein [Bryobacteraceae bacterium]MDW8379997.1 hypothetical protein [Bryobacterales bacterium]
NLEIPNDVPVGTQTLRLQSPYGTVELPISMLAVAPAIFRDTESGRAVIVNTGGVVNSPAAPVNRGSAITIYSTGLGRTVTQGRNQVVAEPVRVVIQDVEVNPSFAGKAEGLIGVYIVNVTVPAAIPPGLAVPLVLRQSGVESNSVSVAIR